MTQQLPLPARVKALAGRKNGMHSSDIPDRRASHVSDAASSLVRKGELFRVVFNRRHVRYYTDPLVADATRERVRTNSRGAYVAKVQGLQRAPWSVDDPAVVPAHVKVQVCPSFTPRFAECVAPFVYGFAGSVRVRHA